MRNSYKIQKLISRYSKAYYTLYKDEITFKSRNALLSISKSLDKAKNFLIFISNTLKNHDDLKVSILNNFFKSHDLNLPFEALIRLLLNHNRLVLLSEILKKIVLFYDLQHDIVEFKITTSSDISDNLKMEISSFLSKMTKKTIIPCYNIDSSLIAGFRAQSKDFLYENSLRKKLQTLTHLID